MSSVILGNKVPCLKIDSSTIVGAHFPEPELQSVSGVQSLVDGVGGADGTYHVDVVVGLVDQECFTEGVPF